MAAYYRIFVEKRNNKGSGGLNYGYDYKSHYYRCFQAGIKYLPGAVKFARSKILGGHGRGRACHSGYKELTEILYFIGYAVARRNVHAVEINKKGHCQP